MQRVIASQKNMGMIKARLEKFMSKGFIDSHQFTDIPRNALKIREWYCNPTFYPSAKITRHHLFKKGLLSEGTPEPLVHINFNRHEGGYISEGDILYFAGDRIVHVTEWFLHNNRPGFKYVVTEWKLDRKQKFRCFERSAEYMLANDQLEADLMRDLEEDMNKMMEDMYEEMAQPDMFASEPSDEVLIG